MARNKKNAVSTTALIEEAVAKGIGTEEELLQLSPEELQARINASEESPGDAPTNSEDQTPPDDTDGETPEEEPDAEEAPAEPEKKKAVTVNDLIRANRIKVAK